MSICLKTKYVCCLNYTGKHCFLKITCISLVKQCFLRKKYIFRVQKKRTLN